MKKLALKMNLLAGMADEYRMRHNEIWPELKHALTANGLADYSIYLDAETNILFAVFRVADESKLSDLANLPIMKKWWAHMADIMETNLDQSPVAVPLTPVFHMD